MVTLVMRFSQQPPFPLHNFILLLRFHPAGDDTLCGSSTFCSVTFSSFCLWSSLPYKCWF